jgi:PTH2 family peptidyl-tRNA hydrolase
MIKQVIVARTDLNMRKGKLAAQVAHASMGVILGLGRIHHEETGSHVWFHADLTKHPDVIAWIEDKFTKIVVGVDSEEALHELQRQAQAADLPCCKIQDSGLTEFGGVPTYTTLAIGPAEASRIDAITGNLKLL